jgi:hypothetical protein
MYKRQYKYMYKRQYKYMYKQTLNKNVHRFASTQKDHEPSQNWIST